MLPIAPAVDAKSHKTPVYISAEILDPRYLVELAYQRNPHAFVRARYRKNVGHLQLDFPVPRTNLLDPYLNCLIGFLAEFTQYSLQLSSTSFANIMLNHIILTSKFSEVHHR